MLIVLADKRSQPSLRRTLCLASHLTQLCANLELSCRCLHGSAAKVLSFITSSMDIETVLRSVATRAGSACPKKSLEQTYVFCVKHA